MYTYISGAFSFEIPNRWYPNICVTNLFICFFIYLVFVCLNCLMVCSFVWQYHGWVVATESWLVWVFSENHFFLYLKNLSRITFPPSHPSPSLPPGPTADGPGPTAAAAAVAQGGAGGPPPGPLGGRPRAPRRRRSLSFNF